MKKYLRRMWRPRLPKCGTLETDEYDTNGCNGLQQRNEYDQVVNERDILGTHSYVETTSWLCCREDQNSAKHVAEGRKSIPRAFERFTRSEIESQGSNERTNDSKK